MAKAGVFRIFFLLLLFFGCDFGGSSNASGNHGTAPEVHFSSPLAGSEFHTMSSNGSISLVTPEESYTLSTAFRWKRDTAIWLSFRFFGFTVAKAYLTPNTLEFYEKKEGSYYRGDYALTRRYLGIPLHFEQVQRILIGQSLHDFDEKDYKVMRDSIGLFSLHRRTSFGDPSKVKYARLDSTFRPHHQRLVRSTPEGALSLEIFHRYGEEGDLQSVELLRKTDRGIFRVTIHYDQVDYDLNISMPYEVPADYRDVTRRLMQVP